MMFIPEQASYVNFRSAFWSRPTIALELPNLFYTTSGTLHPSSISSDYEGLLAVACSHGQMCHARQRDNIITV